MTKNRKWEFDAAGWGFWIVLLVLLVVPCFYLSKRVVFEGTRIYVTIAIATVMAAIGAGVISWAVNAVLQRHRKKQRNEVRKKAKKKR